ncbi:hypothetical protein C0989_003864 [Termitomyces sp. Mn162]|nr:hypothetical protein C0989_003864 [Termitomyces sp. Mn162]
MTRPFFTRDRIRDFDIFDRHANTVLKIIKERMRSGNAIDFQDLMSRFTIDSASEFLFGSGVHTLAAGIPYPLNATSVPPNSVTPQTKRANEFAAAFLQVQEVISRRFLYGSIWPLMEIFEDKTKKSMEIVRAYLDPIIKEAVVKNANNAKNVLKGEGTESYVDEGETLIDHLVRLSSAMYPTVHARLREEVLDQVGPTKRPDFDDIKDMKYLRAVINETLRLFPTV